MNAVAVAGLISLSNIACVFSNVINYNNEKSRTDKCGQLSRGVLLKMKIELLSFCFVVHAVGCGLAICFDCFQQYNLLIA
ncbi:hypothetical protein T01_5699 [Trichinella spiralis]|uniref:Uncharacterized protein n=1 Tax=Trichinella spiralis TaxID=6334 RepID=A0A0V1B8J8_TRISP|nr:hypothetical protein T01_5699 [Trichinella spiralis]